MESLKFSQELHKLLLLQSDGGKEIDPCANVLDPAGSACLSVGIIP